MDYIFGYGSLINKESRASTGQSGVAIPVRVAGYERAWNLVDRGSGITFLGAVPQAGAAANGMLAAIPESELPRFDRREGGYTRTRVEQASVSGWNGEEVPDGAIWIYVPDRPRFPTNDCPIVQSYLDVVLAGCLEVTDAFAAEFVRTTTNWDGPWLDDRSAPRGWRTTRIVAPAVHRQIDRILAENGADVRVRISGR